MSPQDKSSSASTADLRKKLNISAEDRPESEGNDPASAIDDEFDTNERVPRDLLEHPSYLEVQKQLNEADAKIADAEQKAAQSYERMLRIQADLDNVQRRMKKDIESAHKYALENFTSDLLPIIDGLEKAVEISQEEGVVLTLKLFYNLLEKYNIEQINPDKAPFNPELHQAVSTQVDPHYKPGTVLSVLQKGYVLNNRLVRPALVIVSKNS